MKILKRVMLVFLSFILLIAVAVFIFFKTAPQLGASPDGERLERMKAAENYDYPVFVNTIETKMDMPKGTMGKVLRHYFFEDKSNKNPKETIRVAPFDKNAFEDIPDDSIAFVWFGHSTILMKLNGTTILADPVLMGKRASMFPFLGPARFDYTKHVTVDELPSIDAMILSHDHYDHLDYPTIKALKDRVERFFLPLGVGAHFEHWGVEACAIYWHYVDVVWVFFYPALYLVGSVYHG